MYDKRVSPRFWSDERRAREQRAKRERSKRFRVYQAENVRRNANEWLTNETRQKKADPTYKQFQSPVVKRKKRKTPPRRSTLDLRHHSDGDFSDIANEEDEASTSSLPDGELNKDEQIKRLKMMLDDAHATIAQLQSRSLDVERWKEEYELANDRVFQLENELKKVKNAEGSSENAHPTRRPPPSIIANSPDSLLMDKSYDPSPSTEAADAHEFNIDPPTHFDPPIPSVPRIDWSTTHRIAKEYGIACAVPEKPLHNRHNFALWQEYHQATHRNAIYLSRICKSKNLDPVHVLQSRRITAQSQAKMEKNAAAIDCTSCEECKHKQERIDSLKKGNMALQGVIQKLTKEGLSLRDQLAKMSKCKEEEAILVTEKQEAHSRNNHDEKGPSSSLAAAAGGGTMHSHQESADEKLIRRQQRTIQKLDKQLKQLNEQHGQPTTTTNKSSEGIDYQLELKLSIEQLDELRKRITRLDAERNYLDRKLEDQNHELEQRAEEVNGLKTAVTKLEHDNEQLKLLYEQEVVKNATIQAKSQMSTSEEVSTTITEATAAADRKDHQSTQAALMEANRRIADLSGILARMGEEEQSLKNSLEERNRQLDTCQQNLEEMRTKVDESLCHKCANRTEKGKTEQCKGQEENATVRKKDAELFIMRSPTSQSRSRIVSPIQKAQGSRSNSVLTTSSSATTRASNNDSGYSSPRFPLAGRPSPHLSSAGRRPNKRRAPLKYGSILAADFPPTQEKTPANKPSLPPLQQQTAKRGGNEMQERKRCLERVHFHGGFDDDHGGSSTKKAKEDEDDDDGDIPVDEYGRLI